MSVKVVQITIPTDRNLPDIINSFSPEENYLMIKIGSETLREGRKVVTNLTSDEILKKTDSYDIAKLAKNIIQTQNDELKIMTDLVKKKM